MKTARKPLPTRLLRSPFLFRRFAVAVLIAAVAWWLFHDQQHGGTA